MNISSASVLQVLFALVFNVGAVSASAESERFPVESQRNVGAEDLLNYIRGLGNNRAPTKPDSTTTTVMTTIITTLPLSSITLNRLNWSSSLLTDSEETMASITTAKEDFVNSTETRSDNFSITTVPELDTNSAIAASATVFEFGNERKMKNTSESTWLSNATEITLNKTSSEGCLDAKEKKGNGDGPNWTVVIIATMAGLFVGCCATVIVINMCCCENREHNYEPALLQLVAVHNRYEPNATMPTVLCCSRSSSMDSILPTVSQLGNDEDGSINTCESLMQTTNQKSNTEVGTKISTANETDHFNTTNRRVIRPPQMYGYLGID